MAEEKFDGLLLTLTQQAGGVDGLFESVFSFLRRKTDFFSAPGGSEQVHKLVDGILEKNFKQYVADQEKKEREEKKKAEKKRKDEEAQKAIKAQKVESKIEKKIEESDVLEMSEDGSFDISADSKSKAVTAPVPAPIISKKEVDEVDESAENEKKNDGPTRNQYYHILFSYVYYLLNLL